MSAPTTFERVYAGVKAWLASGRFRPGDRLEPSHLSVELNSSVTPVRDALHRLTGERLVEAPRSEGFRVPIVGELMLRQLYAWHRDLLLMAIALRPHEADETRRPAEPAMMTGIAPRHLIFLTLAEQTGSAELAFALHSVLERLEPYQRFEADLIDQLEEETAAISHAVETRNLRSLRALLVRYHRRRIRIVPDLIALASRH